MLIAGGINSMSRMEFDTLASAEVLDPSTGNLNSTGTMTMARYLHCATGQIGNT